MRKTLYLLAFVAAFTAAVPGQRTSSKRTRPATTVATPVPAPMLGKTQGQTFTSTFYGFAFTVPEPWHILNRNDENLLIKKGIDLRLKAPDSLPPMSRALMDAALRNVNVLMTAYRAEKGATDNAVLRVSVEDLSKEPQIKDAVDYFDAIRFMYGGLRLPSGFRYSETQAERLGPHQFGFLDVWSESGKKRMYATVRDRDAIMFTLTYTRDEDLAAFRDVLSKLDLSIPKKQ